MAAYDDGLTVTILDQTFGHYDEVAVRVTARFDIAPRNPEGIVKLTGIEIPAP